MEKFEELLDGCKAQVERSVKFRISNLHDAEDVLQEVYAAAYRQFPTIKDAARFKPWLLGIARNKCADYFRARYRSPEVAMDLHQLPAQVSRGASHSAVQETLLLLTPEDQAILRLFYWQELSLEDMALRLSIPLGTVKSRLHRARNHFRERYPHHPPIRKGVPDMKMLPQIMPEYTIKPLDLPPFPVQWEEMMGWFIVPRLGEKLSWAMYDFPERTRTEWDEMTVLGRAEVHGIEGVEISAVAHTPMDCNAIDGGDAHRTFIAQLTDTHCRALAETHVEGGVKKTYTFLDGDSFLNNWGFGDDNCGNEVHITAKGDITRSGSAVTAKDKEFLLDVVGRYEVTIGGKTYDTICVMDVDCYNEGAVTEQYLDQNGRTVLWRRFNPDDWKVERHGRLWSEMLPENERITVNGKTCVHWYDCITSYIL